MNHISLPQIFQDGMVLQRRKPVCIWGWADEGSLVTVNIANQSAVAVAKDGAWRAYLPPMEAGTDLTLTVIAGGEEVRFSDVAIGEVWLAGGQSNMEFLLRDDAEAEAAAKTDKAVIRCYEVPKIAYPGQEQDRDSSKVGVWCTATGSESLYFTAVGFYFAQKLYGALRVPVGIVNCTWGGTSASAYTAEEYLTGRLAFYLDKAKQAQAAIEPAGERERYAALQRKLDSLPFNNSVSNLAPIAPDPAMMKAMEEMNALFLSRYSPFRPCGLYETMLKPTAPYGISGVIWYQGESDEPYADLYEELMRAMIACWRDLWHEPLPLIQVQLASFEQMMEPLNFVPIRAAQERLTRSCDSVWLACAMDAGMRYDIHPKHKRPVGERLALQALSKVYGRALLADSPAVEGVSREGATVRIRFANTGGGLVCRGSEPKTVDVTVSGVAVLHPVVAVRENIMRISAPELEAGGRIEISFCQRPYCELNVYNSADLPVLPFVCAVE